MSDQSWSIGQFLAHRITELEVYDFFVVPGDFNLTLLDQMLENPQLRMTNCCNELNTGYAADGYARCHPKRVAVVVVTYMVGSLSILNAIAGAYSEHLRIIVICGGPPSTSYFNPTRIHHSLGHADKSHSLRIFKEVTCASICLDLDSTTADIDDVLKKAFVESRPVYIEIPVDVARSCSYPPALKSDIALYKPDVDLSLLQAAIRLFKASWTRAYSPVLLIGSGVRGNAAEGVIDRLVKLLKCATFFLPDGKSLVSEELFECGGMFWSMLSDPAIESTCNVSNLWITIGCRWNDLHFMNDLNSSSRSIFSIEERSVTSPAGQKIDVPMGALLDQLINSDFTPNITSVATWRQHKHRDAVQNIPNGVLTPPVEEPLSVNSIGDKLYWAVEPGDTIIAETGQSWFTGAQIDLPAGTDFQIQFSYASIGWSLPAALGAERARQGKRVFVLIGDGSLQMVCQELSTLARNKANVVVVIINNRGYQVEDAINSGPYNEIGHWDYTALAESMWNRTKSPAATKTTSLCKDNHQMLAIKIQTESQWSDALEQIRQYPRVLAVLECCVDPREFSPSILKLGAKLANNVNVKDEKSDESSSNFEPLEG